MFLIIFLLLKSAVSVTITKEVYYTLWDDSMIYPDVIPVEIESVASQLQCAVLCTMHDLCIGANVRKGSQTCQMYKMEYERSKQIFIKSDNNSEAVIVKGSSVIHFEKTWMSHGAIDCYVGNSENYSGRVSKSYSNITCQSWNVNDPWPVEYLPVNPLDHTTKYCRASQDNGIIWCYTNSRNYSFEWESCKIVPCFACDVTQRLPEKPVNTSMSFSLRSRPAVVFECESYDQDVAESHCPVSVCQRNNQWSTNYSVSCSNKDYYTPGSPYTGKMFCTMSGILCQCWNTSYPHKVLDYPENDDFYTNYCRSVGGENKPWCYTMDRDVRWEHCPVVSR